MPHVTLRARSELHGLLLRALELQPRAGDAGELGLRLVRGAGDPAQLRLALDVPREGDEVVEHDGRSVLIVDGPTNELLEGLTLDLVETPDGPQLSLRSS